MCWASWLLGLPSSAVTAEASGGREGPGARTFDDLRRADEFRVHNGKPTKYTRRRDYKHARAKSAAGSGAEAGLEAEARSRVVVVVVVVESSGWLSPWLSAPSCGDTSPGG